MLPLFGRREFDSPPKVATKVATFGGKRIDCDTQDGIEGVSRMAYKAREIEIYI